MYYQACLRALWLLAFILAPASWESASSRALSLSSAYDGEIHSAVKTYWIDFDDWKYWKAQLYQESLLDPLAKSSSGAMGLAQFMPKTWEDITRQLGWSGISATQAGPAIEAGAFYMVKLRRQWARSRVVLERHKLAEASYNAGLGSILRAQNLCSGAVLWNDILSCLPQVTGVNSTQTITYVQRIEQWRAMLEN